MLSFSVQIAEIQKNINIGEIWNIPSNCKHEQNIEKLQTCENARRTLADFFLWSGLPAALFMVLQLDSKGAKGLAALLRSDGFFSGAVGFVRRTLARIAFHGFSIGFQRCKSVQML